MRVLHRYTQGLTQEWYPFWKKLCTEVIDMGGTTPLSQGPTNVGIGIVEWLTMRLPSVFAYRGFNSTESTVV